MSAEEYLESPTQGTRAARASFLALTDSDAACALTTSCAVENMTDPAIQHPAEAACSAAQAAAKGAVSKATEAAERARAEEIAMRAEAARRNVLTRLAGADITGPMAECIRYCVCAPHETDLCISL